MAARISTFDDWVDLLREWQNEIGLDHELIDRFMPGLQVRSEVRRAADARDFLRRLQAGRRNGTVLEIPDQRMRDAVLNMVVFQGDTEFASNEQQRFLVNNAPSEYDLASLVRIMVEETRHGYPNVPFARERNSVAKARSKRKRCSSAALSARRTASSTPSTTT